MAGLQSILKLRPAGSPKAINASPWRSPRDGPTNQVRISRMNQKALFEGLGGDPREAPTERVVTADSIG
jgi:hypothetical protein